MCDNIASRERTVQLSNSTVTATVSLLQWCIFSESATTTWCQIIRLRKNVLYSHWYELKSNQYRFEKAYWVYYNQSLMSDSIVSRERIMQSSAMIITSRSRKARAESSELHKKSIRSILHSLHRCMLKKVIRAFDALFFYRFFDHLSSLSFRWHILWIFYSQTTYVLNQRDRNVRWKIWDI